MKLALIVMVSSVISMGIASGAQADTTVIETTTTSTPLYYSVPSGVRAYVVDPLSHQTIMEYSTTSSSLPVGAYVVESSSGRVLATVAAEGRLTPFTTEKIITLAPAGKKVILSTSSFAARRDLMSRQINEEFDAGRLTNRQVNDLRQGLLRNANLEAKKSKDGKFSSSEQSKVERGLNDVASEFQGAVSETNKRRARIGLKVD